MCLMISRKSNGNKAGLLVTVTPQRFANCYIQTHPLRMFFSTNATLSPLPAGLCRRPRYFLLSNANDTARGPPSRIACSLALLMAALAQVIGTSMYNDCTSQYALRPDQLDQLVLNATLRIALGISLEVAEIANVTLGIAGGAVGFGEGVDYSKCPVSDMGESG